MMEKDYLLIAVDHDRKFSIRFLSLQHAISSTLALKSPPPNLTVPYIELVLGSVLLGSRQDEQESKLFKLKLSRSMLQINCEVNPRGAFRSAVFPKEGMHLFEGDVSGDLKITVLNKKNEVYTSVMETDPASVLKTFRNYLEMSVQSQSLLFMNADPANPKNNFALWIEKLPDTSLEEWHSVWERFADERLFLESFKASDDPDGIMRRLFQKPIEILTVTHPSMTCHCSLEAFQKALEILPKEDLLELFMEGNGVESQCDYCGRVWRVDDENVRHLLDVNPQIH